MKPIRDRIEKNLELWGDYGYEGWESALDNATLGAVADRLAPLVEDYVQERLTAALAGQREAIAKAIDKHSSSNSWSGSDWESGYLDGLRMGAKFVRDFGKEENL